MIPKVTHAKLRQYMLNAYRTRSPYFIWGHPAIGKTDTVEWVTERIANTQEFEVKDKMVKLSFNTNLDHINDEDKFSFIDLSLPLYDVAELKGIPFANAERTAAVFLQLGLLPVSGHGIILVDDLNTAPPLVQSNMYSFILKGRMGSYSFPQGWYVCAAGNLSEDHAHTFSMPTPLLSRFNHLELLPATAGEWAKEWAIPNGISHYIINFLLAFEKEMYNVDFNADEDVKAFPSHRTWAMAHKNFKGMDISSADAEFVQDIIGSSVGTSAATMFVAWLKTSNSFNVEQIFTEGKIKNIPTEPDELFGLMSSILSYFAKQRERIGKKKVEYKALVKTFTGIVRQLNNEHFLISLAQAKSIDKDFMDVLQEANPQLITQVSKDLLKYFADIN